MSEVDEVNAILMERENGGWKRRKTLSFRIFFVLSCQSNHSKHVLHLPLLPPAFF